MITIKTATSNTRGFLRNLFDYSSDEIEFHYEKDNLYEVVGKSRNILAKMIKWPIFDFLGIFQIVKVGDVSEDACFSYNRFLKTDKPYYILLENPSALVNYCWERPKHLITKLRLRKCFMDSNLKGIVCMSKTCFENFGNLYDVPKELKIYQNYPFIPDDLRFSVDSVQKKAKLDIVECLYISSDFELKGGRDILSVIKKINSSIKIHVTIITQTSTIREEDKQEISNMKDVSLVEFNLTKEQLNEFYKKAAILLNPTRGDSFSLVTLEAIKYGCTVLATDVYAIKEMDIDGYNGFITKSMIKMWDDDGKANKYYRTHQKELVWSGKIDEKLVNWMYDKLLLLANDRDQLERMCLNSLRLSRETDFSENSVIEKWETFYKSALNNK